MRWSDIFRFALTNLWRRKLRTFLTMIGAMIGTASIVVMVSLGIGINQGYIDSVSASGDITTINAAQYTAPSLYRASDTVWQGRGGHWDANHDAATFKTVKTDAGYAIEMQIPFGANYTAKEGAKITVAYHINSDETGDTARDEEIFAGDASAQSQAWSAVDSYDPMILSADVYVEPTEDAPAADNTADAGIVVAAVVMACAAAVVLSKKSK